MKPYTTKASYESVIARYIRYGYAVIDETEAPSAISTRQARLKKAVDGGEAIDIKVVTEFKLYDGSIEVEVC